MRDKNAFSIISGEEEHIESRKSKTAKNEKWLILEHQS